MSPRTFSIALALILCAVVSRAADESTPAYDLRHVMIWSDGTRMAGDLYVPLGLKEGEKRPAIVFCAGTGGTKKGNGAQYGRRFVKEGFVVLAFDYRGWGESDCKLMMTEAMPAPAADGT